MQERRVQHVAVIGAGISGVLSAAYALRAGLKVSVFERNEDSGGIWLHKPSVAIEDYYRCTYPMGAEDSDNGESNYRARQTLLHAPPGPCYDNLTTNIATALIQTKLRAMPEGTPKFCHHSVIKQYIQEIAEEVDMNEVTAYGASVAKVWKEESVWHVNWTVLQENSQTKNLVEISRTATFDAVVVASGHYNAPRIPKISGLDAARSAWPSRIIHSRSYRNAAEIGTNVLIIGGGVSSTDIARDISSSAKRIYQSTRNSAFDMPASVLPKNATRVAEVVAITMAAEESSSPSDPIFAAHLRCGSTLHHIDSIILCTGYHVSLPFLPQYNDQSVSPTMADSQVLITDGDQVHNLHRDIFYIPNKC